MIVPNNRYRPPPYPGIKVLVAPSVVTLDLFMFFISVVIIPAPSIKHKDQNINKLTAMRNLRTDNALT
ncbi:unnamed protein product [Sphagnum jensenii]|uniref:Uncharacterized protein n=1 Tax=Sphagnum jensenii TaxID=128206 RepID=A0ABP1A970_9BRYO